MTFVLVTLEIDDDLDKMLSLVCQEHNLSKEEAFLKAVILLGQYTEKVTQSIENN